jgi:putative ABC transport system permease protein
MLSDLRLALRALRRTPGFVAAAVLTLGLGIGATTAIFSVVDATLLRPLPYRDAEQLVTLWSHREDPTAEIPPSYADFEDWRRGAAGPGRRVQDMAFARSESLLLRGGDGARMVNTAFVSDGFFRTVGGRPLLGRTVTADEERAGGARTIVLGHRLWQARFGGDPTVVGRTLDFAQGSYTVVGVMPPGYEYPGRWAEAWAPLAPLAANDATVRARLARRELRVDARVIARLAPDASTRAAQADLATVARRLAAEQATSNRDWGVHVTPLREQLVQGVRQALLVLLGAVGLLLLVACADVANLSLVRALARTRELSVRAALGATRTRLARQLLAESVVIALGGGVLGAGLAVIGVAVLRRAAPAVTLFSATPTLDTLAVDGRVLGFALAASLATALLFGVVPALHATRDGASGAMREGARGADATGAGRRARDAVVALQIALTLVLLVGAGLLGRSFANLRTHTPGFPIERLVMMRIEPLDARHGTPEQLVALYDRLRVAAAAIPGARSAGFVNHLPMTGAVGTDVRVPGGADSLMAIFRVVDGAYFATAGIPVRRGRGLTDMAAAARPGSVDVPVVVSAELARQHWPRGDALGRPLTVFKQVSGRADFGQPIPALVVGVADDVKLASLEETDPIPTVYVPMTANPWRWGFLVVRAAGDPATLVSDLRRAVREVDPDLPLTDVTTGAARLEDATAERRFNLVIIAAFAGSALLLAAVGLYAVVAHGVGQRRGELGIRAVLGALPGALVLLVLREGARVAAIGLGVGLALALAATRLLSGMLFGVGVRDLSTYLGVTVLLAVVALLAAFVPARRAAGVSPSAALRGE